MEKAIQLMSASPRLLLPRAEIGALPHKKTPSGRTRVLHLNYTRGHADHPVPTEMAYLQFFAKTATLLGIRLEILTDSKSRGDLEPELVKDEYQGLAYTITETSIPVSKWAEDSVEYLEDGKVAVLSAFSEALLHWAMTEGRRKRWQVILTPAHLEEALDADDLWVPLGVRVNSVRMGVREAVAQAHGQGVGQIRAYVEGGNLITGEDASGKPVILVGQDAIATTANLYQLTDDEARDLIREDFGLESIEQVIAVEQPGQFHLDMGLLFLGHGVVILNDSSTALQDAMEMAAAVPCMTTTQMAAKLQLQVGLEALAAQDLASAGLNVTRMKLENEVLFNFFNGEFVEGQDGFTYFITNGGPKEDEEKFEALMVEEWQVVKKVFFSPKEIAHKSLQERGGVGCRLKGSPNLQP